MSGNKGIWNGRKCVLRIPLIFIAAVVIICCATTESQQSSEIPRNIETEKSVPGTVPAEAQPEVGQANQKEDLSEAETGEQTADVSDTVSPKNKVTEEEAVESSAPEKESSSTQITEPVEAEEQVKPAETAAPVKTPDTPIPRLTDAEIRNRIGKLTGNGFFPVHNNGRTLIHFSDVDRNGYPDAFVLTIKTDDERDASFEYLSDFSRLYNGDESLMDIYLSVFFQIDGELISMYRIPAGRKAVLKSFNSLYIDIEDQQTFSIVVSFHTDEGSESRFITFASYRSFSIFDVNDTTSETAIVEDINDDGFIDIIIQEQVIEEGTGYETFFTLYEWDGGSFSESGSANIVRGLKRFFSELSSMITAGLWEDFGKYALSADSFRNFRRKGLEAREIFDEVFHPDAESPEIPSLKEERIIAVVFPEVYENPFIRDESGSYFFPVSLRIFYPGNISYLYHAGIRMNKNFFDSPQFYFVTEAD